MHRPVDSQPPILVQSVVEWRKSLDMTQADVAAKIGITRGAYALWEQGRAPIKRERLDKLATIIYGFKQPETLAPVPPPVPSPVCLPAMVPCPRVHQVALAIMKAAGRSAWPHNTALYAQITRALS